MAPGGRVAVACTASSIFLAAPAAAQPDASAPPASVTREDELEHIIVTARRRKEELQETPVSVVSFSRADLEARSLTNLRDLQNFVPNLTFAPSQNVGDSAGNIFIRGIGQEDFVAGTEPGVGFYLDGVYVARTMGTLMNVLDIARIEVLRGPQGTLYGKNSIGGAINILSQPPAAKAEVEAGLTAGNIGRFDLRGLVNVPLSDRLFARVAAGYFSRDGHLTRLRPPFPPTAHVETNHADEGRNDSTGGRMQLRWLASDTLTIDVIADASRRRGAQAATHVDAIDPRFGILPEVNSLIRAGLLPGPEITNALALDNLFKSHAGGNNRIAQNIEGLAATLTKDLGAHSLRLITAFRQLRSHVATDLDGTWFAILGSDFREHHRQYSSELQASGTFGRLTYTAGLFALGERMRASSGRGISRTDVLYLCGCFYAPGSRPVLSFPRRSQTGGNYAAYAQASLRVADRLSATLGGRYSLERKSAEVELIKLDPDTFEPTGTVLNSGSNKGRWNAFTWRAGLEFQAAPDILLYASAAKGYKSGGFNTRPVSNLPNLGINQFKPETAVTYEAGIRSEWFQRLLRLNATAFHTDYRDIQLRQQTFVDGVLTTIIQNAARARIRGVEIEAVAKLTKGLTAKLAYGHLDPRYLDTGTVPGLTLESQFQRTPRHSFTGSVDYSVPLGGRRLTVHGDYSHRSAEQLQLLASAFDQPGYGLLGARVTLHEASDRWSVAVFGTNLTDERFRVAGRDELRRIGIANSIIGSPRQIGVELKAGF